MCTLLLACAVHPRYRLILAANRDEFYDRETAAAAFWEDPPSLFGGRDLLHGGSWLGVTTSGRIAALTNYREPHEHRKDRPSRGRLVSDFLKGEATAEEYLEELRGTGAPYDGYNLVLGSAERLYYYSNKSDETLRLEPGIYGLSNDLLDTPWPKVVRGKEALERLLAEEDVSPEDLFDLLADRTQGPDEELPDTGVGLEWERRLSSIFIESERYGTRSSTILLVDQDLQATFIERTYDGSAPHDTRICFDWSR